MSYMSSALSVSQPPIPRPVLVPNRDSVKLTDAPNSIRNYMGFSSPTYVHDISNAMILATVFVVYSTCPDNDHPKSI